MYKISGLKKPVIVFLDSPLACQIGCEYALKIMSMKPNQVGNQVGDMKIPYQSFSWRGSIFDYGWVSFHKAFEDFGIVNHKDFKKFYTFIKKSRIFMMIQLDGLCVVSDFPKHIKRNTLGDLSSNETSAIEFNDGYKLHYINGVYFPEDLWTKVVSKKMPMEEIMAIVDVDQRTQAMKYGDFHEFARMQNAKLLDSYQKIAFNGDTIPYELWEFPSGDIFNQNVWFMWYVCPSTKNEYTSGVHKSKTCVEAMARKQGITEEQFKLQIPLVHES